MQRYETLFILHPDVPEAQLRETIDRTRKLIESMSGNVHEIHDWGLRELAYPIEKQTRGNYVLAQYEATSDVVNELERTMKLSDEVLRFVSVRLPRLVPVPPPPPALVADVDADADDETLLDESLELDEDSALGQEGN